MGSRSRCSSVHCGDRERKKKEGQAIHWHADERMDNWIDWGLLRRRGVEERR